MCNGLASACIYRERSSRYGEKDKATEFLHTLSLEYVDTQQCGEVLHSLPHASLLPSVSRPAEQGISVLLLLFINRAPPMCG